MILRSSVILIFVSILTFPIFGQDSDNPFELPKDQDEATTSDQTESSNPFDINKAPTQQEVTPQLQKSSRKTGGIEIGLGVGLLIALALLLTFFRGVFNDFVESAYRDRKFNQMFRRMKSMWVLPNILFYLYFSIVVGIFAHLSIEYYTGVNSANFLHSIGILIGCIAIFFLLKHGTLFFLGSTFEVTNEAVRYSLLIMTFNIIVGIITTPFTILLLLGPQNINSAVIFLGIIVITIILVLFLLRALSISNRLWLQHSFHFFMYLCAIEIAPLFIIAKVLS